MGELKGKSALVTGGTRGIGRATALALADMGADVAINFFRSRESAKATAEEIQKRGVKALAVRANVGNSEQIPKMFEEVKGAFGKLDILVSNAALGHFGNVLDVNDKMWDVAMSTNAKALLYCSQEAVKMMPEGGRIVALTSLGSHRYIPGYAAIGEIFPSYDEIIRESTRRTPLGRVGTPEEVANVAAFLCTGRASWVSGQVIIVDGGYTLG
ncbi:MAG: SDR family oxidoreductase [Candidatus Eisenbacteria bacterium]|uniref:SDR family oxidoreductase n=1 Tax=Eiseniibacteriota bacterium TaxID=2212470 RepID=A0A538SMY8_UNCEI|nr:MAG: SDR family oxidoreductase [Candidatus Eisenbacteria bacterium]